MADARIVLTAVDKTAAAFSSARANLAGIGERAEALTPLIGNIGAVAASAIGGLSVAAMAQLARAQLDAIDGFNDLRDATGSSIENISALDDIARRNGATFETVSGILVRFNKVLGEAKADNEQGTIFKALGLDLEQLKRMDPAEALQTTAKALATFEMNADKARAVQTLFGKSVQEAAPFLNDLAEAGELNAKVTAEQAEAAEKFNKAMFRTNAELVNLGRQGLMPVISWFNDLTESIRRAEREGDGFLKMSLKFSPNMALFRMMGIGQGQSNGYADAKSGIADIDRLLASDPSLTPSERASLVAKRGRLDAQRQGYLNSTAGAGRGEGGYSFSMPSLELPADKPGGGGRAGPAARDFMAQRQWYLAQLNANDIEQRLKDEAEALKRYADTAMQAAKQIGDAWDEEQRAIDAFAKRQAARDQELDAEIDQLSGRADGRRRDRLSARLESMRETLSTDEFEKARKAISEIGAEMKSTSNVADLFASTFSSSFEKAILSGRGLGDVIRSLGQDIFQIALRTGITAPLGQAVGKSFEAGMAPVTSWISSLLPGFDGGGYTGPGVRSGGLDGKGGFMAMLHPNETVIDHTRGGGGRPVMINITQTVGDIATTRQLEESNAMLRRQIAAGMQRAQVYGA